MGFSTANHLRWPVEEAFGLDHSQVRLNTALVRHIVLTLAALAVCAQHRRSANPRTSPRPAHHTR